MVPHDRQLVRWPGCFLLCRIACSWISSPVVPHARHRDASLGCAAPQRRQKYSVAVRACGCCSSASSSEPIRRSSRTTRLPPWDSSKRSQNTPSAPTRPPSRGLAGEAEILQVRDEIMLSAGCACRHRKARAALARCAASRLGRRAAFRLARCLSRCPAQRLALGLVFGRQPESRVRTGVGERYDRPADASNEPVHYGPQQWAGVSARGGAERQPGKNLRLRDGPSDPVLKRVWKLGQRPWCPQFLVKRENQLVAGQYRVKSGRPIGSLQPFARQRSVSGCHRAAGARPRLRPRLHNGRVS